ncbi:MAG: SMC-Scp complex subunit ScpB [Deltaproteobacteria bacterium]|nr:SMC-Scp complex subunit ScpB [Deltaproteobacteria bacterium]
MDDEALTSAIESVLFVSDRPVTIPRLKEIFEQEAVQLIEAAIERIKQKHEQAGAGLELRQAQGGYQLATQARNTDWVRKFLETKPFRLSRSALETLSIIAYKQPITRAETDKIRGIDCSHLFRVLIEKGLVKMAGKADVPGRPVQYATTPKFLELVGLNSISELPPLSELQQLQGDIAPPPEVEPIEQGLERFMQAKDFMVAEDHAEELESGLQEIEQMLQSAKKGTEEVYASPLHAEIGNENSAALEAFLALTRGKKPRQQHQPPVPPQETEMPLPEIASIEELPTGSPEENLTLN